MSEGGRGNDCLHVVVVCALDEIRAKEWLRRRERKEGRVVGEERDEMIMTEFRVAKLAEHWIVMGSIPHRLT